MDDWFGLQRGLVAVGLLAVVPGCPGSDKDTTTDGTNTEPGSTGDTGGNSTSGGTTGGTSGDTPTGSGTGSATGTSGDATTGDSTTTTTTTTTTTDATTGGATTGGAEVPPVCQSYGAKVAECYVDPELAMQAAQYCADARAYYEMTYGADCVQAFEAFMACISALSCEVLMGPGPYCDAETMAQDAACTKP